MIIKKDSEVVKAKVERKSLALKAKKESSDEECLTFESKDKEYAMASDSGDEDDEKVNNKTCLLAQASSKKNKEVDLECVKCHMLKIENENLKEEALKLTKFEKSTHCLNEMLNNQKPSGVKLGLGFNSFEASSSGTKEIKFVKALKKVSPDGGPINMGGPLNVQAAPKANMRLPLGTTLGSEKSVSFQKSILGPRPKHIIVNNVRVPVASDNEVKQFYKPLSKPGICLGVDLEPDEWIKDSGCSKHMTGNRKLFLSYKAYNGGNVIFGSNLRGNIIGKGQICDNKCSVTFSKHDSEITKDGKVIGRGIRKKGLYMMKLGNKLEDKICLATIDENSTLWHRRLGHANMRFIQSLASKELVRNLPKLKFDQHFCDACKIRKQAHASHKAKNIVLTTRRLELLHMDLFGPSSVRSYGRNRYTLFIVDDYSRYTWTRFLKDKTEAFDQFEIFNEEEAIKVTKKKNLEDDFMDETLEIDEIVNIKESRNHPLENIIGNLNQRTLRSQAQNQSNFFCFISTTEPKNANEALTNDSWIVAMQEDFNQLIDNDVWDLVPQPRNMTIIGTKWVFRNKLDENVARLESIRILLAYACALDFKLFQMDVKSAFLTGFINEEVYMAQPPGFIEFEKLDHVYKLKKPLYGLKQAPKAWFVREGASLEKGQIKIFFGEERMVAYFSQMLLMVRVWYEVDILKDDHLI
ncbi:retrovirus-related pol polyprotein from transposon TNT 1-94 [Tanacetum coccineum]